MIPVSIKQLIDRKLADGRLPPEAPTAVYGGQCNEHHSCDGCDEPIHLGDTELETIAADGRARYYHPPCGQYAAQSSSLIQAGRRKPR